MGKPDEQEINTAFLQYQERLVLQASDLSLGTLTEMVSSKSLDIEPAYQRRQRWEAHRQSELIESFLINVPIPPIYLAEEEYGVYSIIDGKQRLISVHSFMTNKLRLQGLVRFPHLNGMRYQDLPSTLQNALRIRPYFRAITLLRQSDPTLKYEVFLRLNEAGIPLLPQEIRNVAFRGALNDAVISSGDTPFLRAQLKATSDKSPNYQKMVNVEWVLRFLALRWRSGDFSGELRRTLDEFMLQHRDVAAADVPGLVAPFHRAIAAAERIWGSAAFRRPSDGGWRDQALSGMYDAEMLAIDQVDDDRLEHLRHRRALVLEQTRNLFANHEFERAVRQGTNTPSFVRLRVGLLADALRRL